MPSYVATATGNAERKGQEMKAVYAEFVQPWGDRDFVFSVAERKKVAEQAIWWGDGVDYRADAEVADADEGIAFAFAEWFRIGIDDAREAVADAERKSMMLDHAAYIEGVHNESGRAEYERENAR